MVSNILNYLPKERQVMLFSATYPRTVQDVNSVNSNFAQCGNGAFAYTLPYCTPSYWGS